ncbi:MAG: hypothetical protein ACP5VF_07860 [Acidobacteriota bacterium]
MRKLAWLALLVIVGTAAAAGPEAPGGLSRLEAAAQRSHLDESALMPVLSGLDQLQQEGLPTARYVDRMVECLSKGAPPERIKMRASFLLEETRTARVLVDGLKAQGLKGGGVSEGWSPVEEMADALTLGPITPEDLTHLAGELKTDRLERVLAGAHSLAHLRAIGLSSTSAHGLLAAMPGNLPDEELLRLPWTILVGRRCGMQNDEILKAIAQAAAKGKAPSDLARGWARDAGLRGPGMGGGMGRGPGGPGRGMGSGPAVGPGGPGQRGGPGGAGGPQGPGGSGGRR